MLSCPALLPKFLWINTDPREMITHPTCRNSLSCASFLDPYIVIWITLLYQLMAEAVVVVRRGHMFHCSIMAARLPDYV